MRISACLLPLVIMAFARPAAAQVYEVGQGGSMQIRDGGGAVVWRDAGLRAADRGEAGLAAGATALAADAAFAAIPATDTTRLLTRIAARYSLSPALLEALVWQESRWNHAAVSPKGAVGLTQLMPATARDLGVDPRDPVANLEGGARYLRSMLDRFDGDVIKALAAYNAGPARVERAGGIPAIRETRGYVAAILARLNNHAR